MVLISHRRMDPLEFLQTCERLAQLSPLEEADGRSIMSRVYYAFFLTLRDGLAEKDAGFKANVRNSGQDHTLVRDYLKGVRFTPSSRRNPSGGYRVAWYERYDAMFKAREVADYRMEVAPEQIRLQVSDVLDDMPRLRALIENLVA